MIFSFSTFIKGLGVGLGLICAIGMQNSFVLKQGILKNHVFVMALTCSIIDAFLITAGVNGLGELLEKNNFLLEAFHWGGIIFLFGYGIRSFVFSFKKQSMTIDNSSQKPSLKKLILTLLTVSLLNPHTYLDSFVLMAGITAYLNENDKIVFTIGAVFASFIWFFLLSYGAGLLRKFFEKTLSWKILDFLIGCIMFSIAFSLIYTKA